MFQSPKILLVFLSALGNVDFLIIEKKLIKG